MTKPVSKPFLKILQVSVVLLLTSGLGTSNRALAHDGNLESGCAQRDKGDKPEKPEKPEKPDVCKPEKPEKPEKPDVCKPEKPEKPDVCKPDKPGKAGTLLGQQESLNGDILDQDSAVCGWHRLLAKSVKLELAQTIETQVLGTANLG
jgi:hypothetical protein